MGDPMTTDPKAVGAKPPLPRQQEDPGGFTEELDPRLDHGEHSYRGCGKRQGPMALITGADSGIGRAVAIAFAREDADVLISICEPGDAKETAHWVEEVGRRVILVASDVQDPEHCRRLVTSVLREFGKLDALVYNCFSPSLPGF
jgi:hypothetical protein